jgi:hypothetical protein
MFPRISLQRAFDPEAHAAIDALGVGLEPIHSTTRSVSNELS